MFWSVLNAMFWGLPILLAGGPHAYGSVVFAGLLIGLIRDQDRSSAKEEKLVALQVAAPTKTLEAAAVPRTPEQAHILASSHDDDCCFSVGMKVSGRGWGNRLAEVVSISNTHCTVKFDDGSEGCFNKMSLVKV